DWDVVSDKCVLRAAFGSKIFFWLDRWCESRPLKYVFSQMFALASNNTPLVGECIPMESNSPIWNVSFERNLQDWEMEGRHELFKMLYDYNSKRESSNKILWSLTKEWTFSIKSFLLSLHLGECEKVRGEFPWKAI